MEGRRLSNRDRVSSPNVNQSGLPSRRRPCSSRWTRRSTRGCCKTLRPKLGEFPTRVSPTCGRLDGVRQLRSYTSTKGERTVTKTKKSKKANEEFVAAVGRALRKSARTARRVARMHGTPVYIWENG